MAGDVRGFPHSGVAMPICLIKWGLEMGSVKGVCTPFLSLESVPDAFGNKYFFTCFLTSLSPCCAGTLRQNVTFFSPERAGGTPVPPVWASCIPSTFCVWVRTRVAVVTFADIASPPAMRPVAWPWANGASFNSVTPPTPLPTSVSTKCPFANTASVHTTSTGMFCWSITFISPEQGGGFL